MNKKIIGSCAILIMFLLVFTLGCPLVKQEKRFKYDGWMYTRCGRCHQSSEFESLLEKTREVTRYEFEKMLAGMEHDGLTMTEDEINEALDFLDKQKLLKQQQQDNSI